MVAEVVEGEQRLDEPTSNKAGEVSFIRVSFVGPKPCGEWTS